MKRPWIMAGIVLAIALVVASVRLVSAQTPAATQTPAPAAATKIEGSISSVDVPARKVTITPRQGPPVTLTVTDDTEIEVWGKKPADLKDLKTGQSVEVSYVGATLQAVEIEAKRHGEPPRGDRQGFFGTITGIAAGSFTLDTRPASVTFTVNASTEYWNPPSKDAALKDLKVGDRAAVLAERTGTTLTAKRVLVIPSKPIHQHSEGAVTRISGRDITITYDTDRTVIGEAPPGKIRKIELGDLVTATIIRTPGVEKVVIKDIEGSDKVLDRLLRHAEKKGGKDREDIQRLVEKNRDKHLEVLQRVLAKAPEAAKTGLMKAIEKSRDKGKALGPPARTPGAPGKVPGEPGKAGKP